MFWALFTALSTLVYAFPGTQTQFHSPAENVMAASGSKQAFKFKDGSHVFTPKDLVELSRPGPGAANTPGDLILVPVSKYSFADKKYVCVSSLLIRFIPYTRCVLSGRRICVLTRCSRTHPL